MLRVTTLNTEKDSAVTQKRGSRKLTLLLARDHRKERRGLAVVVVERGRALKRELLSDSQGEIVVDSVKGFNHNLLDRLFLDLAEFKLGSRLDVLFLDRSHRVVEKLSLFDVLRELRSTFASLDTRDGSRVGVGASLRRRDRVRGVVSVREVVDLTLVDLVRALTIALVVHDGTTNGLVDGDVGKVDTNSRDLSVEVREAG